MKLRKIDLMEKYQINAKQAGYIIKEAKDLNVSIENIDIVETGTATEKGKLIKQVVFNSTKHICYI